MLSPLSRSRRAPAKGFTLIEAAIVLAVLGIVVSAIWGGAVIVKETARVTQAVQGVQQLSSNLKKYYKRFATLAVTTATNVTTTLPVEVYPSMIAPSGATTPYNPWGGGVQVWTSTPAVGDVFTIIYDSLPRQACVDLLTRTSNNEIPALYRIDTNGANPVVMPSHIGVNTATTYCNIAGATNYVSWIFYMH